MAITKIGQEVLEKESSLVSLLGIPAAVHVAQNLATKKALKSPKFHRRLLETFSNNFKNGKDSVSTTGQIGFGAAKGAVPELAILDNEAGHVANHLREFLKKKNISGDLSKRVKN